jgi:hypothetical protein
MKTDMNEASVESVVLPLWQEKLRHMLGAGPERRKRDHGFRNHYRAMFGAPDYKTMQDMASAGLVKGGVFINGGKMRYFHATVEGCKAIGLSKAAIKRAIED